jgi:DNA-binding FadR family transcriptional regulator
VLHDMRSQVTSSQGVYEATWAFHTALANIGGNYVMAKLVRFLCQMIAEIQLKLYSPTLLSTTS